MTEKLNYMMKPFTNLTITMVTVLKSCHSRLSTHDLLHRRGDWLLTITRQIVAN